MVIYIFVTIWLVLHSSESVLHVYLGHSNGQHENTFTIKQQNSEYSYTLIIYKAVLMRYQAH